MSKFKTIVFGGSGFLGSHIADALSNSGHEVTIYDLVESPFLRDDQKMIIGSLQDKEFLQKAISGKDFFNALIMPFSSGSNKSHSLVNLS